VRLVKSKSYEFVTYLGPIST